MSGVDCKNDRVGRAAAVEQRVRDVMVGAPKTLPGDCSVADVRALFANPHVRLALLADGERFAGSIERDALPAAAADDQPARELARRDVPTITSDAPVAAALAAMDEHGQRRLVVLAPDGQTLQGLLCLTSDRGGFCQS